MGVKGIHTGKDCNLYKHGESDTRLYHIWSSMRQRCINPKWQSYKYYGGKGIKVCEEWQNYICFAEWSKANGYTDELSIDRIDSDGNYEPSNCRWVDMQTQYRNKKNSLHIEYKGEVHTILEWAEILGIDKSTLFNRYWKGDRGDRLFRETDPRNIPTSLTYKGETHTLKEWSEITNIKHKTLKTRIRLGWSIEDTLTKPLRIIHKYTKEQKYERKD